MLVGCWQIRLVSLKTKILIEQAKWKFCRIDPPAGLWCILNLYESCKLGSISDNTESEKGHSSFALLLLLVCLCIQLVHDRLFLKTYWVTKIYVAVVVVVVVTMPRACFTDNLRTVPFRHTVKRSEFKIVLFIKAVTIITVG